MRTSLCLCLLATACSWGGSTVTTADSGDSADTDTRAAADLTVLRRWPDAATDARPTPDSPNVLLVILCTWRADQLGPWGGPQGTAPTLVALADKGVHFQTTVASAPWTRPASAAILTGHPPDDLAITEPGPKANHRALRPETVLLPEVLHDAGYSTLAVTANPNLNAVWGFDQGYDVFVEMNDTLVDAESWRATGGHRVVEKALAELAERPDKDRPVFVQLTLIDAHAPVFPPPEEVARFKAEDVPDSLARYRAALRRGDLAVGELLTGLDDIGIDLSETLVVLVGDHGEGLSMPPSHGPHHGFQLYPSTVHVPWVISGPGVAEGARIGGLASHLDVTPTVLSLAGVSGAPETVGKDLSELVRTGEGTPPREAAFVDTRFRWADRTAGYTTTMQCQIDHNDKATAQAISRRRTEPFSTGCCAWTEDAACDRPEWDSDLLAKVRGWRRKREIIGGAQQAKVVEPDALLQEQLRALGYKE